MSTKVIKPSIYNEVILKKDGIAVYNTRTGRMLRGFDSNVCAVLKTLDDKITKSFDPHDNLCEYLYEQDFLVDAGRVEQDEMAEMERIQTFDDHLHLIILPTEYCNFRCSYCYEEFRRGQMSEETQQRLVAFVDEQLDHHSGLIVSWFGGEPLEAIGAITSLSKQFINLCRKKKKVYFAGMTTNGYDLTSDVVKQLKRLHITEYQITLDGLPRDHDRQRVLEDGGKTAEKIISNLVGIRDTIKTKTLRITLRTNFTKGMLERAEEYGAFLQEHFLHDERFGVFWQVAEDYGNLNDESLRAEFCTESDYRHLIREHALKMQNNVFESAMQPAGTICYAMKRNAFVISSDGKIKKCTCNMEDEENCFGSLGGAFDEEKHDAWLNRPIHDKMACYDCKKRPMCHFLACKKMKTCPPNLFFYREMLEALSDDESKYIVV